MESRSAANDQPVTGIDTRYGGSAAALSESRERLQAWVDDITAVGRFERPIYKNPSELRRDCQLVLDALNHLSDDTLDQLEENLARVPR